MTDLTLAFDTSHAHVTAVLLSGDAVISTRHEEMAKGQAERLFPMLEEMLKEAGAGWRDLSTIGVGIGPGNFTGIRISVASARGLALSLGIPAIGVSVLDAQASGIKGAVISVLDARREQFYVQVGGTEPQLLSRGEIASLTLPQNATWVGHGAAEFAAEFGGVAAPMTEPLAVSIARLARARRDTGAGRPTPLYIRAADAKPARDPAPTIVP